MTAYDQSRADLASEVVGYSAFGDSAMSLKDWASAVRYYQQAGDNGATMLGPEIDAAGYPGKTQPLTQQAWAINGKLAAFTASSATQANAISAQGLVYNMVQLYTAAINAGEQAESDSSRKTPVFSGTNVAMILGAALAGGVLLALVRRKGRR